MNALVPIVMWGWIPFSLLLFVFLPARRAVLLSVIGAWLFLPQAEFKLPAIPDYTRMAAATLPALMGAVLFNAHRFWPPAIRWYDTPMIAWILVSIPSSVMNGLGIYDGVAGSVEQAINFGVPYLLGRVYFSDRRGIRELAMGIFLGAVIYIPLILYELRMSPQLHHMLYGSHPSPFHMAWRWGGYRPWVFMDHGIELGLWMAIAAMIGVWAWRTGALRRLWGIGMGWWSSAVFVVFLLCKAANGWGIALLGFGSLFGTRWWGTRLFLMLLLLVPPVYVMARTAGGYQANLLIGFLDRVNPGRADSLRSRIAHEQVLMDRAARRPLFGWGTYGRNRPENAELPEGAMGSGTTTDSMWIITYGQKGMLGLMSYGAVLLLPLALLLHRLGPRGLAGATHALAVVLGVALAGYAIDGLYAAMINPVYYVAAGGLVTYAAAIPVRSRAASTASIRPAGAMRGEAADRPAAGTGGGA